MAAGIKTRILLISPCLAVAAVMLILAGCVVQSGENPAPPVFTDNTTLTAPVTISPAIPAGPDTVLTSPLPASTTTLPTASGNGYNELMNKNYTSANSVPVEDLTGSLFIHVRAGGSVKGLKVFIVRDGMNVPPVDYYYLPDGTVVESQNKGYLQVTVLPDGNSESVRLAPGSYTAYLPSGMNAGQPPEDQSFMIRVNGITHIWFEGFSASSGGCNCGS